MLTNDRLDVLRRYRAICSEIVNGKLYLGGYQIACDWEKLKENKITHVINLSGDTCINVFQDKLDYRTYYVLDTPQESIEGVLYDSIEWIDTKLNENDENRIYIHCQEGVSRSSSIVIGYLMWKYNKSFSDASEYVRERRSTSSPNIGFTYQLLLFQKALNSTKLYLAEGDKEKEVKGEKVELPILNHLGKKHRVTSLKLYYMSKYGIPVSLINWKGDGNHGFNLNSNKIYLLRQSLIEEETLVRREKLWIWIGNQAKEGVRESILGVLRFCRQILKIEIGHHSSLELENLEIRADLIIGALGDDKNSTSEYITNILSSTIILEYFHEFSESGEFMQILAPNTLHVHNSFDVIQRSFSSPSIKSVSRNAIPYDFENDDEEGEDEIDNDNKTKYIDKNLNLESGSSSSSSSSSSSDLSSLISLDESLPYFSSFPSSNGSPIPSVNSPSNYRSPNAEFRQEVKNQQEMDHSRGEGRISQHHFSLDSQSINYTKEHLLTGGVGLGSQNYTKVVIPKLNFTFKGGDKHLEVQFQDQKQKLHDDVNSSSNPQTFTEGDQAPVKKQLSIHFNQDEIICFNSNSYSKRSSVSQERLSINEDCYSNLDGGGIRVLLFRFPDYFGSESLRFFDSEDLLPSSVCPLIVIGEISSEEDKEQPEILSPTLEKDLRATVVYLWIGSKTSYFNQAKEILSKHFELIENHHNNHVDVRSLLISEKTEFSQQINHYELDITQLLILLIRNNSKLSLMNIKSVYFEFEGEESNSFWNYFYL